MLRKRSGACAADASCASTSNRPHAWRHQCRCEPPRPLTSVRKTSRPGSRGVQLSCLASEVSKQVLRIYPNVKLSVLARAFVPPILPVWLLLGPCILRLLGRLDVPPGATASVFIRRVTKHQESAWQTPLPDRGSRTAHDC